MRKGKRCAGNCLLLSDPITVHEQEWNAVRWRDVFEVCQRNSSRVSAEKQPGGFPIPRCSPRYSDSGQMRANALVSREGAPRTCDPFDCRQGYGIHIRTRVYGNPWPLVIRVM